MYFTCLMQEMNFVNLNSQPLGSELPVWIAKPGLRKCGHGSDSKDHNPTLKVKGLCMFPQDFFTWKGSFLAADLFVEFITRWAFQPWALFKWLWIDRGNTDSTTYSVCKSFSLLNAVPKPAGCLKASGQLFTYTQQAGCVLSIHPIFWCIRVENHSSIGSIQMSNDVQCHYEFL